MSDNNTVRVACAQFNVFPGKVGINVAKTITWIDMARQRGANIVVLPELVNTGYKFRSRRDVVRLAEKIPSGPTVDAWSRYTKKSEVYLVAGLVEKSDDGIYNSAVLIGPEGYIATYRKNHLSDLEKELFNRGNLGFVVAKTELGRIGILICYDVWFPEAFRLCAAKGADLICVPANWTDLASQPPDQVNIAVYLCMSNAHSNGVFVAGANRVGSEDELNFVGQSFITNKYGWPVSKLGSRKKEELVMADCDLYSARNKKVSALNDLFENRRLDLYPYPHP